MVSSYYENLGTVSATNDAVTVGGDVTLSRRRHTFYIVGDATVATGAVTIEQAPSESFTGTWEAIGSAETVVASTVVAASVEGAFGALRARVTTDIETSAPAATTATITYVAN